MLSEMFYKLWNNGLIQLGVWETIYMTLISSAIAYVIGLPLGVILSVTDANGIRPTPWVNRTLGFVVNFFRSIPFIILMVAMLPVAKFIIGTSLGNGAVIVMLVIAAAPYVARMVESSVKEVGFGVIEAAQSMGCTNMQIVTHVLLPEAKPALIQGAVISDGHDPRLLGHGCHDRRHRPRPDRHHLRPPEKQRRYHLDMRPADGRYSSDNPDSGNIYSP